MASMGTSEDEEILISIRLGTGTNACYEESIKQHQQRSEMVAEEEKKRKEKKRKEKMEKVAILLPNIMCLIPLPLLLLLLLLLLFSAFSNSVKEFRFNNVQVVAI